MSRRLAALALALPLLALAAPALTARAAAPAVAPGAQVTLLIPRAVLETEGSSGPARMEAKVESGASGVVVNGRADWREAGFPSLLQLQVTESKVKPKAGTAQVTLSAGGSGPTVQLAFSGITAETWPATFGQVTLDGPASTPAAQAAARSAVERIAASGLTGPLADLPKDLRLEMVEAARAAGDPVAVSTDARAEGAFLVLDLGLHPATLSSTLLDAGARARQAATDRMLPIVDALSRPATGLAGFGGLVLKSRVPTADLQKPGQPVRHESVELEVPALVMEQFGLGSLAAGDTLDACTIRVDGKPVSTTPATAP